MLLLGKIPPPGRLVPRLRTSRWASSAEGASTCARHQVPASPSSSSPRPHPRRTRRAPAAHRNAPAPGNGDAASGASRAAAAGGTHQKNTREQRLASCSGLGFTSGCTGSILPRGWGARLGRRWLASSCSWDAAARAVAPVRSAGARQSAASGNRAPAARPVPASRAASGRPLRAAASAAAAAAAGSPEAASPAREHPRSLRPSAQGAEGCAQVQGEGRGGA